MPNEYNPTAEHLAALGYGRDECHDMPTAHLVGYSRQVPAPAHPYYATLVVQVRQLDKLPAHFGTARGPFLTRYPGRYGEQAWPGHPLPTALFFEQLLQALGWPVGPALPAPPPEASPELMLLRWIAYHPAEAWQLRDRLSSYSCLPGLHYEGLVQLTDPERQPPGAGPPKLFLRPGLIEATAKGELYLHHYRHHRETPKNLPAFITDSTK